MLFHFTFEAGGLSFTKRHIYISKRASQLGTADPQDELTGNPIGSGMVKWRHGREPSPSPRIAEFLLLTLLRLTHLFLPRKRQKPNGNVVHVCTGGAGENQAAGALKRMIGVVVL